MSWTASRFLPRIWRDENIFALATVSMVVMLIPSARQRPEHEDSGQSEQTRAKNTRVSGYLGQYLPAIFSLFSCLLITTKTFRKKLSSFPEMVICILELHGYTVS